MKTYDLPKKFWEDHVDRALRCVCEGFIHDEDNYGKDTGRHYRVELAERDAAELLSDAKHYSDVVNWSGSPESIGLQSSARATVKRLTA